MTDCPTHNGVAPGVSTAKRTPTKGAPSHAMMVERKSARPEFPVAASSRLTMKCAAHGSTTMAKKPQRFAIPIASQLKASI